ncbi:hypothetical protein TTHERM_00639970 (macronuclear) [Tetrahymena thermophila SB210]|uniref:Uncharacterized protein n=1 Tax=Tetrahymena thermophila (strain SB210) TaxID=312017 RepID=Q23F35_TETTS|nr:hypothetical protein TTHERM_00639970 [Tetrahymena thermophila SB210]EAR95070.2 hypothetical protein TTHERM_00639970 [Tetrahymena thermophila SB210]|eukprot:XP_001015315.2 hypothetical protein TTHERM_00639970 [Tetrahymena thermophila SB210]
MNLIYLVHLLSAKTSDGQIIKTVGNILIVLFAITDVYLQNHVLTVNLGFKNMEVAENQLVVNANTLFAGIVSLKPIRILIQYVL